LATPITFFSEAGQEAGREVMRVLQSRGYSAFMGRGDIQQHMDVTRQSRMAAGVHIIILEGDTVFEPFKKGGVFEPILRECLDIQQVFIPVLIGQFTEAKLRFALRQLQLPTDARTVAAGFWQSESGINEFMKVVLNLSDSPFVQSVPTQPTGTASRMRTKETGEIVKWLKPEELPAHHPAPKLDDPLFEYAEEALLSIEPVEDRAFSIHDAAVSGDTLAIAAFDTRTRSREEYGWSWMVLVYIYSNGKWTQQAELHTTGEKLSNYGTSRVTLALEDNTLVVGSSVDNDGKGAVYIYTRVGSTWKLDQRLTGSNGFGEEIGVSRDSVIVQSENGGNQQGRITVYRRQGSTWKPEAEIVGGYLNKQIAISGDVIVAGGLDYQRSMERKHDGMVSIFERVEGQWQRRVALDFPPTAGRVLYAFGVSVDGRRVLVTAHSPGTDRVEEGAVYVMERGTENWELRDALNANEQGWGTGWASRVLLRGDVAYVSASFTPPDVEGQISGVIYVFVRGADGVWWEAQKIRSMPRDNPWLTRFKYPTKRLSRVLSVDGDVLVIQSVPEASLPLPGVGYVHPGFVHVFRRKSKAQNQVQVQPNANVTTEQRSEQFGTSPQFEFAAEIGAKSKSPQHRLDLEIIAFSPRAEDVKHELNTYLQAVGVRDLITTSQQSAETSQVNVLLLILDADNVLEQLKPDSDYSRQLVERRKKGWRFVPIFVGEMSEAKRRFALRQLATDSSASIPEKEFWTTREGLETFHERFLPEFR
jgi:hypothetical protein